MRIFSITNRISNRLFFWRGFSRRNKTATAVGLIILGVFSSLYIWNAINPFDAEAAWFNDGWSFRKSISISAHTAAETNVYLNLTGSDDLDTSDTTKFQTDCGDLRFTDEAGNQLPYYIVSGCGTNATVVHVFLKSFPAGAQTFYFYYGNPTAANGFSASDFATAASNVTFGSQGSEENGPHPIAYWAYDEGYGFTANDTSSSDADGVLAGSTPATWQPENLCVINKCLNFPGGTSGSVAIARPSETAIALDNTSQGEQASGTSLTVSHTIAGSNRVLLVWVSTYFFESTPVALPTATYNGVAMEQLTTQLSASNIIRNTLFRLVAPATGAHDIVVTISGSNHEIVLAAVSYTGVDQSNPNDAAEGSTTTGNNPTDTISSQTGDLVVGGVLFFNVTPTVPGDQTQRVQGGSASTEYVLISDEPGAPSVTHSYTIPGGSSKPMIVVNLNRALTNTTIQSVKSVAFWVRPASSSAALVDMGGSNASITASSGTISATNFTSPTIYVNGVVSSTLTANRWNYVVVTTGTGITAAAIKIGNVAGNYLKGSMDEVKFYNFALSATQVKANYNSRGSLVASAAVLGASSTNQPEALSNGLAGYWKLDESSGDASDASGNGTTLTNNSSTSYASGKFGYAGSFVAASTDYFSTATTISGVQSVAFWANPSATTDEFINLTSGAYITASSGTISATGFTNPKIYVNGVLNGTITASVWNHVVVTTETAINANQVEVGRANSSYNNGLIDEARVYNRALSPADITNLYNFAPTPVGYWDFEEGTGTSVVDKSANGNTGTWNATSNDQWTQGKMGRGGYFNGSSYVGAGNGTSLQTGAFTVTGWTIMNSNSADLVSKGASGQNGWRVAQGDTRIFLQVHTAATLDSPDTIGQGQWVHFAAVYEPGVSMALYINGKLSISRNTDVPSTFSNSYDFEMGTLDTNGGFGGKLDEVKLYNYARTPAQVVSDMNAGHPNVGSPIASPLGHWQFDEGTGTTANNSGNAGSTINGTISGATWNDQGKYGKALAFDGVNDLVSVASNTNLDSTSGTWAAWIKTSQSASGASRPILSRTDSSSNNGILIHQLTSTNKIYVELKGSGGGVLVLTGGNAINDGSWHHIALTFDGANTAYLYVDSKLITSGAPSGAWSFASQPFRIAEGLDSFWDNYNGLVDDVKIYSYPLTASEVKLDYNKGAGLVLGSLSDTSQLTGGSVASNSASAEYCVPGSSESCAPPVARWDFEEGTGVTAKDSSGNSNTATFNGNLGRQWSKPGKIGNGITCDGSTNYLSAPDANSLDTGDTITYEAWVKLTSLASTGVVIDKQEGSVQLAYDATNDRYRMNVSNTGADVAYSSVTTTDLNWHHVAITKNGSARKVYLDGIDVTTLGTNQTASNNSSAISICQNSNGGGGNELLPAIIDQIRIFNYARSAAQVMWDYNRGAPVGYWDMDECQGTRIGDLSGFGNLGTLTVGGSGSQTAVGTCVTPTNGTGAWYNGRIGKYNSSVSLDGNDDYVSVPTSTSLALAGSFTTAAWVKWDSTTADYSYVLERGVGQNYYMWQDFLGDRAACGANHFVIGFRNSQDTAWRNACAPFSPVVGTWYHVAGVYTSGSTFQIYINGKLVKTEAQTDTPLASGSQTLYFGANGFDQSLLHDGSIDDVRVYGYPLTASQMKMIYNQGAGIRFGPNTGAP